MKTIHVKLLRIKVAKFIPRDGSVELSITYSNETIKEILKTERIVYPESMARRIIAEIRRTIKSAHTTFESGEILDSYVNVTVEEEDAVIKKVAHFLEQLRMHIERVKSMKVAHGYIDAVRSVRSMGLDVNDSG